MRLNILRRGGGLGGKGLESGIGGGRVGAYMICLLWGTTALGMKIDTKQQLGKREPEPQRARVTEWVTVTMHGGWRVTEYSTTTITPTAAAATTAIVTVTSIITTGTTVTNTVTATTTPAALTIETTTGTESTVPTTTISTEPTTTASTSTFTAASASQIIETTGANTNTTVAAAAAETTATITGAGTPTSKPVAIVAVAGAETPPAKDENIATVTETATGAPLSTSTVVEIVAAPTTTKWTGSWGQGAPVLRRQDIQETITFTTTNWDWTDGVTTSTITVYATPTNAQTTIATPTTITTTMVSTQVSIYTTQQTVTATAIPSTSATAVPSTIAVDDTPTIGGASPKTPNVEVIVGACFGALVGFIGIFVLAYLWAKKRRDENLRKESVGFSNESFLRSSPGVGSGVRGMIGSLRRGPSTRYNNIPSGESVPNMSPLPILPHSPPPQLPQLRVMPPSGEFNYEYTFGSPVSSIGEAQLHALTSGAISPPPVVAENHQEELVFGLPRHEREQPPWSSPVLETGIAETVVSSVSAQSAQSNEPAPSSVSGAQSPTRKPVPRAADDLVSP